MRCTSNTSHQLLRILQSSYASQILTIPTLCLAKMAVMLLIRQLFVQKSTKRVALGFGLFLSLWCLASMFVLAFQCQLPQPWRTYDNQCINLVSASVATLQSNETNAPPTVNFLASIWRDQHFDGHRLDCLAHNQSPRCTAW